MAVGKNTALFVLLAFALLLRLGWGLSQKSDAESLGNLPDQREYLALGWNLIESTTLVFFDDRFHQEVYAYRTPGYPLFVACCGASPRVVRIAQAILDTSTVLAIYLLARRWLAYRPGLLAAALVAFNPWLIYFTGLILSETVFSALLAWSLVALWSKGRGWIIGCALLGLAGLVRPSALGLAVLIPAIAGWVNWRRSEAYQTRGRWLPLMLPATGLIFAFLLFFPWAYRNHRVLGTWLWTATNAGITKYDGFNPNATGASDQRFVESMPELLAMKEVERNDYLSALADKYVAEHPDRRWSLAVEKIKRTWSPMPLSDQFSRPAYRAVALAYTLPFFALVLAGLAAPVIPWRFKILLIAPAVYFTFVHAFSVGSLRYRLPADPPMAVVAASAVALADRRPKGLMTGS